VFGASEVTLIVGSGVKGPPAGAMGPPAGGAAGGAVGVGPAGAAAGAAPRCSGKPTGWRQRTELCSVSQRGW